MARPRWGLAAGTTDADQAERQSGSGGAAGLEALHDRVRATVTSALDEHQGDADAASAALIKRAIPDVMDLFATSRVGARYEHSDFPPLLDILKKISQKGADAIWEGRPKWRNPRFTTKTAQSAAVVEVAALDMNAAYLSALKTWLPIGQLPIR